MSGEQQEKLKNENYAWFSLISSINSDCFLVNPESRQILIDHSEYFTNTGGWPHKGGKILKLKRLNGPDNL